MSCLLSPVSFDHFNALPPWVMADQLRDERRDQTSALWFDDSITPTAAHFAADRFPTPSFPSAFSSIETPASAYANSFGPSHDISTTSPWGYQYSYGAASQQVPPSHLIRRASLADVPVIRPPAPPSLHSLPASFGQVPTIRAPAPPAMSVVPASTTRETVHTPLGASSSGESEDGEFEPASDPEVSPPQSPRGGSMRLRRGSSASVHSQGGGVKRSQSSASVSSRSSRSSIGSRDKRFACPSCEKHFARRFNLRTHIASTHEQLKPYVCPRACGKSFSRRHDLGRHLASVHDSTQAEIAAIKASQPPPTQQLAGISFDGPSALAMPPVQYPSAPSTSYSAPSSVAASPADVTYGGFVGVGLDGNAINAGAYPPLYYG